MTTHELAMGLRRAYLSLHRRTNEVTSEEGVTADQFVLLAQLAHQDALTQSEVGKLTNTDPNTLRAMILILERRGMVVRTPHPDDGRANLVRLTAAGQLVYRRLWRKTERLRRRLSVSFSASEVESMRCQLAKFSHVME